MVANEDDDELFRVDDLARGAGMVVGDILILESRCVSVGVGLVLRTVDR